MIVSQAVLNGLGSVAAFCTTVSLLPQLLKVVRTKSAKDISVRMFLIFSTGVLLWFVYGLLDDSLPMMVGNGATFLQAVAILYLKFHYAAAERKQKGARI